MYTKEYNINFVGMENLNLKTVIDYLKEKMKYEMILVECGISTVGEYYLKEDIKENPIDLLMLSIYQGTIDNSCIGPPFPALNKISETFNQSTKT